MTTSAPVSFRNLSEFLETLESRGLLVRITSPINKDTELHPLVRLQYRGLPDPDRRGFLFENVTDGQGRRYEWPIAVACMAGSRAIYALGMGVSGADEVNARWGRALTNPIAPRSVTQGPVQTHVYTGSELDRVGGVGLLPVPISTPGLDNAPYTSASHWLCRDPESGRYNLGNYRGMVKAPRRLGCYCGEASDMLHIWRKYRALNEPMPAALICGAPPHISYSAVARLPRHVDEYWVAGGLAGRPVDLVRCVTVDLEVPAEAEIVVEGTIPTDVLEPEGPFGEYFGYMGNTELAPFFEVTAITHRPNPIYQSFVSEFPPGENSVISGTAKEAIILGLLQVDHGMTNVLQVAAHEATGSGYGLTVIQVDDPRPGQVQAILDAMPFKMQPKMLVVVDKDVDPRDADAVNWAIAFRCQPARDMRVVAMPESLMDPSVADPTAEKARYLLAEDSPRSSSLCVDATRKWPYPPTSLPTQRFMERALELWGQAGLAPLQLKAPWFAYESGYWPEEREREAELAADGRYWETGAKFAQRRVQLDDDPPA